MLFDPSTQRDPGRKQVASFYAPVIDSVNDCVCKLISPESTDCCPAQMIVETWAILETELAELEQPFPS
jgi:hypothetical protein